MDQEEQITSHVLEKMRDNPNAHLHQMQTEVGLLNRKIEPLLKRVEEATSIVQRAGHHKALSA